MLGVKETQNTIIKEIKTLETINLPLDEAMNYVLSQTLYAPNSFPPFNMATTDGYVIQFSDINKKELKVIDTLKPGEWHFTKVPEGSAIKVFEGTIVPPKGELVIPENHITLQNDKIIIKNKNYKKFQNILLRGSIVKIGELILEKDTLLTPEILAFLASVGIDDVSVYKLPNISLIITGNELQSVGSPLKMAQIYDSNSIFIKSALKKFGFHLNRTIKINDNKQELINAINKVLPQSNLIIITGGITNTKKDFVFNALSELNVKKIVLGSNQLPGEELFFGTINNSYIFATAGNPYAVFINFYEYILPIINKLKGINECLLPNKYVITKSQILNKNNKDLLLRGILENENYVRIVNPHDYKFLTKPCVKEVIVFIPANVEKINPNEKVEVHII